MSYIDNTKFSLQREIYILEVENEMLRNQIRKLKLEINELLVNAQPTSEAKGDERKD